MTEIERGQTMFAGHLVDYIKVNGRLTYGDSPETDVEQFAREAEVAQATWPEFQKRHNWHRSQPCCGCGGKSDLVHEELALERAMKYLPRLFVSLCILCKKEDWTAEAEAELKRWQTSI